MPPITRLLVANRGEIARRIFRSARALGIETVAVASEPDLGTPFAREADRTVPLAGATASETYLDAAAILRAAALAGADAVHPGYGFLAENAAFARACADAGLVFVGPPPAAIEAMGSKLAAKQLMAAHGVPVLPGSVVGAVGDVVAVAEAEGWPILLKAAFGGGGRGMRVVSSPDEAEAALAATRREAAAAFGDGTVFAERLVADPRHVEVQILGDRQGRVVHLFERECSVQRRFQKVIEEAPSTAVDDDLRARLGQAALTAATALGYVGAGTVEFVVDSAGEPFFLEVNTRLQVEHPVTEAVTGLDLVALQLRIAEGEPLPDSVLNARMSGHAIEARLYAEDVDAGFLPVAGPVHRLSIEEGNGIRVDAAVESGDVVSTYYDALLAKVIAWAPTRAEASRRLAAALSSARLHGVATNRDLLVDVLRDPAWLKGETDTGLLERLTAAGRTGSWQDERRRPVHAIAAAAADAARRRSEATVQVRVPPGWRNVGGTPQQVVYRDGADRLEVAYSTGRSGLVTASVSGADGLEMAEVTSAAPRSAEVRVGGELVRVEIARYGATTFADSVLGHSSLVDVERFPLPQPPEATGSLLAPMPGTVTRVFAANGDRVSRGSVVIILEAMKMEHPLKSPADGILVDLQVAAGQQVVTGEVLAAVVAGPAGDGASEASEGPEGAARGA